MMLKIFLMNQAKKLFFQLFQDGLIQEKRVVNASQIL